MLLVIDANIALSSLISGRLTDLVLSPKLDLVAPERFFSEIKKHKAEALEKSRLSETEFDILLFLLEKKISLVPMEEFIDLFPKAEILLKEHKKDAPYIALALKLNCPFWSWEKRFEKLNKVESLTTKDIREKLSKI